MTDWLADGEGQRGRDHTFPPLETQLEKKKKRFES